MWTSAWLRHNTKSKPPQEGELYKILELHQHRFELRYGYYDARERANPLMEPIVIYPDFRKQPEFSPEGFPFVTKMQDVCRSFTGKACGEAECAECQFYQHGEDLIGLCVCPDNRR